MEHSLVQWMTSHGSVAIFGLLVLGIVGLPVPGETLLLLAGVLVGQGRLQTIPTYVAAMTGAVVGISISYFIGRAIGVPVIRRYGHRLHIESDKVEHVRAVFRAGGKWGLMFGYFIPGVRHLTALLAGAAGLEFGLFAAFAYAGACLWAMVFITVGLYVGDRWQAIASRLHQTTWLLAIGAVVLTALVVVIRRSMRRPPPP